MANQQHLEALFERALEGQSLTEAQWQELNQDPVFAQMLAQAKQWQHSATDYQEQEVPTQWQANRVFKSSPTQSTFVPWLAASVMAVAMVFAGVKVMDTNEQLVAQIKQQQQSLEVQQQQMQQLSDALFAQSQWQQQALADVAAQTVDIARSERKDALSTLVDYINTQRAEDNAYLRLQLNDIAEQIEQQPPYSTAYNVESK
ncbi:hypothetical protein [Pseudoalteromonas pernae]|uniref:hypothetical protein n=1 Tax=Pseudoalteromonas pernae TaxID=3118054 RepID=UPI003242582D